MDDHLDEVASPRLPSRKHRIGPIGLDELFGGLARDVSGGDDFAPPAERVEVARPAITAGACLLQHLGTTAFGATRKRLPGAAPIAIAATAAGQNEQMRVCPVQELSLSAPQVTNGSDGEPRGVMSRPDIDGVANWPADHGCRRGWPCRAPRSGSHDL